MSAPFDLDSIVAVDRRRIQQALTVLAETLPEDPNALVMYRERLVEAQGLLELVVLDSEEQNAWVDSERVAITDAISAVDAAMETDG